MNYRLNVENETYPVEDIHFPTESTLAYASAGKPFSFISPVRLMSGQSCLLRGDSGGYQLQVDSCMGFTYTPRFLVSGIIVTRETATARAA